MIACHKRSSKFVQRIISQRPLMPCPYMKNSPLCILKVQAGCQQNQRDPGRQSNCCVYFVIMTKTLKNSTWSSFEREKIWLELSAWILMTIKSYKLSSVLIFRCPMVVNMMRRLLIIMSISGIIAWMQKSFLSQVQIFRISPIRPH